MLIICIISSTLINLLFSEAKKRECLGYRIIMVNYAVIVAITTVLLAFGGKPSGTFSISSLAGDPQFWNRDAIFTYAVVFALLNGLMYYFNFVITQRSIEICGPSMSTLAQKLGVIIIPGCISFLWGEKMTTLIMIGLISAAAAFVLLLEGKKELKGIVPIVFVFGGITEVAKKLYALKSDAGDRLFFNFIVFLVCLIFSASATFIRQKNFKVEKKELLMGSLIGIANLIASYTAISALSTLPSNVVFPTISGAVITLTAAFGTIFYGEKLSVRRITGMLLAVASLILINV